jgi:hypothetical protein
VFNDQEEKEIMKTYSTEDSISVAEQSQKSMEEDLDRDPSMTHYHQARTLERHFTIHKLMDSEDSWNGLWYIKSRMGPLPTELNQSFTTQQLAINAITTYLKNRKENTNV